MSNLSGLLNSNGNIDLAEPAFESMTDLEMAQLMVIALEDAAVDEMTDEMTSEEVDESLLEGVLPEDAVVMERSIVIMDKKAKKQRAYKLAILQCAKEDNNKEYKQLETLWKMEKYLMRRLEKKYAQRARTRMKQTAKKAGEVTGNKSIVKKIKHSLTRSERETQKALTGNNKVPSKVKTQFKSLSSKFGGK